MERGHSDPDISSMSLSDSERDHSPGEPSRADKGHEAQIYKYEALPSSKHIRRLVLEPGEGNTRLVGSLEIVDLRDSWYSYPFEAISYVWGSNIKDQTITIDGKRLPITTSLRNALYQTRYQNRRRALWADSICINQSDNREKEYQVGMMGRIYESSNCTLVCLGTNAAHHANDCGEQYGASGVLESCKSTNSFPDDTLIADKWQKSWSSMLQLPWFKRGWVIQEAALGPQCYLLWRGIETPWTEFLEGYRFYVLSRHWRITAALSPLHYTFTTTLEMLHYMRRQDLTDQKDRIYCSMALPTSDSAMPALQPNYGENTSHLDVYRDFAVKYLEKNANLDILSFVEQQDDRQGESTPSDSQLRLFPSWVPRWDCGGDVESMFDPKDRKIMGGGASPVSDRPFFNISDGNSTLCVKGLVFDSIKHVSEEIIRHSNVSAAVDQVVSIWRTIAEKSAELAGSGSPQARLSLAFLDTLGAGAHLGDKAAWLESQKTFAHLLESEQLRKLVRQNADARKVSEFVTDRSHHRRMVFLGRGHYGVAPKNTREGDVCAVINGTRLPFVLRKISGSRNHYTVIGAAWIQSRKCSVTSGLPMRLGADKEYDDWKDWGLCFEDIFLR